MDSSWDVDSSEGLTQLLSHVQVPETLQTALQQTGLSSISDFAYAYTSSEDLSTFIAKQSQSLWDDLQVTDPVHCPAVARLRRALDLSKAATRAKDSHPSAAPASTATPPATNAWAEHAPPRLDADAVQRMAKHIQGRLSRGTPGQRLHAKHPPAKHSAPLVRAARHHKMGSLATSHVATPVPGYNGGAHVPHPPHRGTVGGFAIFDETPELSIERAHLSPAWLARAQQIFRNAIALCGGAHLAVLKAFDKKILDICAQSLASDSGLRTVNTHELLNADRKLWNKISSLHSEGWTVDEALHEMTSIRADIHALLQPRARPRTPKGPGKGNKGGKGNGKKGGKVQTRLKEDRQVAALTETKENLQLKHGNKTLCLRFNRTECNDKN